MRTRYLPIITCCVMVLLMLACQPDPKESIEYKDLRAELDRIKGQDSMEAANIELYKKVSEVNDTTELGQLDAMIAANFNFHDMPEGMPQGLESFKTVLKGYFTSIPNMEIEIKHILAKDDIVIAHVGMKGVNSGASMVMPATGKTVAVDGYDCIRVEKGKIIELWSVLDVMKMMTQLGLMSDISGEEPAKGK